jgi:general secretion pathway protein D
MKRAHTFSRRGVALVVAASWLAWSSPAIAGPATRAPREPGAEQPERKPTSKLPTAKPTKEPDAPADEKKPARPPGGTELSGDEGGAVAHSHNICKKQPKGAKFRITLPPEAELNDLVNWMMSVSCQKFIWDPKVRGGKVTILSPEPVTVEEAYAAFYASLQTMGLTVEPSGDYFKIVESGEAKTKTLPVYGPDGRAPDNDRYVTQLYRVTGGNSKDVFDLLNKLKGKQGSVDQVGDLLVITDTGANVRRLLKISRQVDDPKVSGEKIFFYQVQYADPESIAETLREIFGEKATAGAAKGGASKGKGRAGEGGTGGTGEASFSRVIVDERSGTLIVVAQEADYGVILKLIKMLDVPLSGGAGRIHVVKLKNADPEEVANVLTQLGSGAKGAGAKGGAGGRNAPAGGAQPAAPAPGGGPEQGTFSGDIRVTADPATRSLVILASAADYATLLPVIDALDSERKQVYIEVYLLELSVSRTIDAGAGGHFGSTFDTSQGPGIGFVGSVPDSTHNSIILSPNILSGIAAGVLGPQVPGSAQLLGVQRDIPAFGVVIQALQSDSDVNFVAEPHVYTADNQEAAIEVGRNVPTQGAVSMNPGGGQGGGFIPFQSVQRQDVTLNVKITPHINDSKTVTLDIEMENNDIESRDPTLGVTTTKRRIKLDKVVARDDNPLVLGGLTQEVERETTKQVPGLGSIPLLGWLFKSKQKVREKRNLLMVLVPHILETPDDARRIHKRRMEERLEFLERYTSFKRRDLDTHVNYRKKAGLLATINAEAVRMEEEDAFRTAADLELQQHQITGEIGMKPQGFDEEEEAPETEPAAGGGATKPVPAQPAPSQPAPSKPAPAPRNPP